MLLGRPRDRCSTTPLPPFFSRFRIACPYPPFSLSPALAPKTDSDAPVYPPNGLLNRTILWSRMVNRPLKFPLKHQKIRSMVTFLAISRMTIRPSSSLGGFKHDREEEWYARWWP